jgi:hypothetical protein
MEGRMLSCEALKGKDVKNLEIVETLASIFGRSLDKDEQYAIVANEIIGAKVVGIGTPISPSGDLFEGGGLAIDFVKEGSDERRRLIFAFNELGLWLEFCGSC